MYNMASGPDINRILSEDPTYTMTAGYTGPVENVGGFAGADYAEDEDHRGLGARSKHQQIGQVTGKGVPGSRSFPQDEDSKRSTVLPSQHEVIISSMSSSQRLAAAFRGDDILGRNEDEFDIYDTITREAEEEPMNLSQMSPEDASTFEVLETQKMEWIAPQGGTRTYFDDIGVSDWDSVIGVDQLDMLHDSPFRGFELEGSQPASQHELSKRKYNECQEDEDE